MKTSLSFPLRLLGLSALLTPLLTACPIYRPPPPPTSPSFSLNFSYPAQADTTGLNLVAYTYAGSGANAGKPTSINPYDGYPVSGNYSSYSVPMKAQTSPAVYNPSLGTLNLGGYALDNVLSPGGLNCRAFRPAQDVALGTFTVTPADVQTCYVYFVAYSDSNGNGRPDGSEVVYMTHDVLSYADKDYTYSGASTDGKISSIGTVRQGWTLLRHSVLQPSSTPGQYKVSMTSVSADDQSIAIEMHEPSPFLTSMSLGDLTGGAK
jgi:hypothetical protein